MTSTVSGTPGGWVLVESGPVDADCPAGHCVIRATWFATQDDAGKWLAENGAGLVTEATHLVPCSAPC